MTRGIAILWLIVAATAVTATLVAWRACARAERGAAAQSQRLAALRTKWGEVERVRAALPAAAQAVADSGGEAALAARVTGSLASAGLPASALSSLSPQSERVRGPSGGVGGLVRRKAAMTLTPVRLPELGAFLDAWRKSEPGWIVSSIEVAPDQAAAVAPGADLPLRATLVVESPLAEETGGSS